MQNKTLVQRNSIFENLKYRFFIENQLIFTQKILALKITNDFKDYSNKTPLALSLGMFDGVHLGHFSILNQLNHIAKEKHLESAILTFWPHPRKVINPNDEVSLLNTLQEKTELLEKSGIQNLFLKTFDNDFRNLTGEDFCREILIKQLNVKHLIIGYDHTFGKNKSGNFDLLKKLSTELDFEVEQLGPIDFNQQHISSTKIRKALSEGHIKEANKMLGYSYSVCGEVVHGKKLGRTIGYPTANIDVDSSKLLPKKGAYIVEVWIDQQFYKGMLSIGTNPTVNGEKLTTEVYILDFDDDLYGKDITVKFRDFLHDEIKFEGLEKLIEKLDDDKRLTEKFEF